MSNSDSDENPLVDHIPFDLFDETIPASEIVKILEQRFANLPKPGRFNVYRPEYEFEKLFRQAVDTSDGLVSIIDELREELKLNDGTTKTRIRFLKTIHAALEALNEFTDLKKGGLNEEDADQRLPYMKCANIVDHIWGTAAPFLNNPFSKKDIYAVRAFNRYFLKAIITKYIGTFEDAIELIDYYTNKTFEYIVQVNIGEYIKDYQDEDLNLAKCIDIFINQKLYGVNKITHLDDGHKLLPAVAIVANDLPYTTVDYKLQMIVQTVVWYFISNIKVNKLLRFKLQKFTIDSLLECYTETLVEDQSIFDED